jgi:hypothetical protein
MLAKFMGKTTEINVKTYNNMSRIEWMVKQSVDEKN